jgi:hypothetical protein
VSPAALPGYDGEEGDEDDEAGGGGFEDWGGNEDGRVGDGGDDTGAVYAVLERMVGGPSAKPARKTKVAKRGYK